jgi:hypothetical protein
MITLIIRFFDVLLIIAGIVLAIAGVTSLTGKTEEQPTTVSIDALEKGQKPDAKWLKVTGGELYFAGTAKDVKIDKRGNKKDGEGYYIPLGSKTQILEWAIAGVGGKKSLKNCQVLVFLDRDVVKEKWPQLADGNAPSLSAPFEPDGTIVVGTEASSRLRDHYTSNYPDLTLANLNVLSHGDKPLQRSGAAVMLGAGLTMVVVGVLIWRIKRSRRSQMAMAPMYGAPGMQPMYGAPGMPPGGMLPPGGLPPRPLAGMPPGQMYPPQAYPPANPPAGGPPQGYPPPGSYPPPPRT